MSTAKAIFITALVVIALFLFGPIISYFTFHIVPYIFVLLLLILAFPRAFWSFFPLSMRRDLYLHQVPVRSKRQMESLLSRLSKSPWEREELSLPPLSQGFRRIPSSPEPSAPTSQEPSASGAVDLVMAPHKPAKGVYCPEGIDRVYFISRREVAHNPFFRNETEE